MHDSRGTSWAWVIRVAFTAWSVGCFSSVLVAQAQDTGSPVRLRQNWQYVWMDTGAAICDGTDTVAWYVLGQMDQPLIREPGLPDLCLRTSLPRGSWPDPALYLESLQISFVVCVDNSPIYAFQSPFSNRDGEFSGGQFHVIPLPRHFSGRALIIRILNPPTNRTGLRKNIRVGSGAELLLGIVKRNFHQFVLGFFFFFVAVFFLVVFLRDLKQRSFFSFGFFSLCSAIYVIVETPLTRLILKDIIVWRYFVEIAALYLIPVGMLLFIEHNLKSKLVRWMRWLRWTHLAYVMGVFGLVILGAVSLQSTVLPFQAMVCADVVVVLVASVREAIRGDRHARMFGVAVGILVLLGLHDNLGYLMIFPKATNLFPWGVFSFTLLMGYILERRMAESYLKRMREKAKLREAQMRAEATERELAVASSIQKAILPASMPPLQGYDWAGLNVPSKEVSGDYFDGFLIPDGRAVIVIADVTGKGIPAALLVSTLHASLHAFMESHYALTDLAARLNQLVYRSSTTETFITFFVGVFEPNTGSMDFINAGHNPPLLVRYDGSVERLRARGVALGVVSDIGFEQGHTLLRRGDRVLLYTDGITEATNPQNELYSERRLVDHVLRHAGLTASSFATSLLTAIGEFTSGREIDDDVTILYCRRL